jgi:hypothetical protein
MGHYTSDDEYVACGKDSWIEIPTSADMNPFVFIANGEIVHELTQVIGVFSVRELAVARCKDRPNAAEDERGLQSMPYDRHWVEEWTLDGDYLGSVDVNIATGELYEHE